MIHALAGTDGSLLVFAHGKEKKLIAENDMDSPVRAAPVAVGNVLDVITRGELWALRN